MKFRRLWWRLFRPVEVDAVLQCFSALSPEDAEGPAWGIVLKDASGVVRSNPDAVVGEIRLQHRTPIDVASNLLFNRAQGHLTSGQYHVYRGVLSSTGRELLSICQHLSAAAVKDGLCTPEDAEDTMSYIRSEIKTVG